ncbi:DoxX family protein [bacterium]|nr:DoxX family protein [bacterium]
MKDLFPYGKVVGWILSVLVSALLVMSAVGKLQKADGMKEQMEHLAFPETSILPIGVAEIGSVALYLFPPTSLFGAVLLASYMGGACAAHVRIGEPCIVQIIIGVVIWIGFVLRRPDVLRASLGLPISSR